MCCQRLFKHPERATSHSIRSVMFLKALQVWIVTGKSSKTRESSKNYIQFIHLVHRRLTGENDRKSHVVKIETFGPSEMPAGHSTFHRLVHTKLRGQLGQTQHISIFNEGQNSAGTRTEGSHKDAHSSAWVMTHPHTNDKLPSPSALFDGNSSSTWIINDLRPDKRTDGL